MSISVLQQFPSASPVHFPTPVLEIRRMETSDVDRVLLLARESFQSSWSRDSFIYEISHNRFSHPHVVVRGSEVVGFSVYWCFDIEAHLAYFAVDSRYRRQNLGSYLLGYLISDVLQKNVHTIYLEVRASNMAARNLYLKHGFKEDGVRRNYYSDGQDDAILMSLSLKEG